MASSGMSALLDTVARRLKATHAETANRSPQHGTRELVEQELVHVGGDVERFYAALAPPVTVGIESTGYSLWFHALLQRLGHTLLVGEAMQIRAMVVRKIKTDRRDARHLRDLLKDGRFPVVWIPDPATRDLRALLKHRLRLVRIRTMIKNGLHAIALNQRLALGSSLWSRHGLAQLQALVLPPHTHRRRDDSLELLQWLNGHIEDLDLRVSTAAAAHPDACRLMTHPGVGPLTALATVLVLGPVARFPSSKHVVSYVGLAPAVHASADKYRLGHISKQVSALLRLSVGLEACRHSRHQLRNHDMFHELLGQLLHAALNEARAGEAGQVLEERPAHIHGHALW
jgi:transposase